MAGQRSPAFVLNVGGYLRENTGPRRVRSIQAPSNRWIRDHLKEMKDDVLFVFNSAQLIYFH